ncbi:hypothetical protein [Siculibacillus lacustris]|nr:hypothetical protein [Siculibacillus lacustris]
MRILLVGLAVGLALILRTALPMPTADEVTGSIPHLAAPSIGD